MPSLVRTMRMKPGHKITITFALQFAEVTYAEVGCSESIKISVATQGSGSDESY